MTAHGIGPGSTARYTPATVRRLAAPLNPPPQDEQPGWARIVVRVELTDGTSREIVADKPTDWSIDRSAGDETTLMDWDETTQDWVELGKFTPCKLRVDVDWYEAAEEVTS